MATSNPFKELESDAVCPPHLKTELVSEIELIRNAVTLVDVYIGDLFALASTLVNPPPISNDNNSNGTAS
ncbi:hypothetical protein GCM10028805_09940 [Spirosoma harenae]